MSGLERLLDDLRRAYAGDPWHGPSVTAILNGVDAATASTHPISGLHSIWENVLHMSSWTREVARRLQGHPVRDPELGDWPPVKETSPQAWNAALADLARAQQELEQTLMAFPESRLDENVGATRDAALGAGYSFAIMVSGLVQHHAYHGGQIALLKKAAARKP